MATRRETRARRLLAEAARRFVSWFPSLEALLTSEQGFALTTATPAQRAICRIVEGRPLGDLRDHPHVKAMVGRPQDIDGIKPKAVVLLAGVRTAKSLTAATLGVHASQTVDTSRMREGETPRFSVTSLKMDLAQAIMGHLVGNITAKPMLRRLLVQDPGSDSVLLRSPHGGNVEVKVVAGARAGSSLVSYWSAGGVFDEAPRMVGASEGVINLEDGRAALEGRLLEGAQRFEIGSPWAPWGPIYDTVMRHRGMPTPEVVVIVARGDWLNPHWWTPERQEWMRNHPDPIIRQAYKTDFLAEFAEPLESVFSMPAIERNTRGGPLELEPQRGHEYVAALDPATRRNAWTLVVGTREGNRKRVVVAKEWQGRPDDPLKPREVLEEIAGILRPFALHDAITDQYSVDAYRDLAEEYGLSLLEERWTSEEMSKHTLNLAAEIARDLVELPPVPSLRKDLAVVQRRPTPTGVRIVLPTTPDGRHADFVPAMTRCFARWIEDVVDEPEPDTPEAINFEAKQRQEQAARLLDREQSRPWWQQER